VGARFGIKPVERRSAIRDVDVNVDEAGSDIEAGGVDDFSGGRSGNVFIDGGDFAGGNGDVHDAVNVICGVDDVAALEEKIVVRSLRVSDGEEQDRGSEE
jgi:hypothetical protein